MPDVKSSARYILRALMDAVWPSVCCVCEGALDDAELVCLGCLESVSFLEGERCEFCSAPKSPDSIECRTCATLPPEVSARVVIADYATIRPWIIAYKYHRRRALAPYLGGWLVERTTSHSLIRGSELVLPVPVHRRRQRERGFNQSDSLAEQLAQSLDIQYNANALVRHRPTLAQTSLVSREQRRSNVAGAFGVTDTEAIMGRRIIVVDDVITTGETIGQCAATLCDAGAIQVVAVALAHPFHTDEGIIDLNSYDI
jgi:ComF family protein